MHARHPARDDEADAQQAERVRAWAWEEEKAEWGSWRRGDPTPSLASNGRKKRRTEFCPSLSVLSACSPNKSAHSQQRQEEENRPPKHKTVTLSHSIKSEKGTLEILSKTQSILAPNVYKDWNGRRVSGVAQILLSGAEMLRRYCCCCFCCRRTQRNRTAHVDCTTLSIFSSDWPFFIWRLAAQAIPRRNRINQILMDLSLLG